MTFRKMSVVMVLAVSLAGCGQEQSGTSDNRSAMPGANPGAETAPPKPSVSPPKNTNDRRTPLQRLCWARQELVLQTATGAAERDAEKKKAKYDSYGKLLKELDRSLATDTDGVPESVENFRARLITDVQRASESFNSYRRDDAEAAFDASVSYFDFENYPNLTEYLAAARQNQTCAMP